MAMDLVRCVVLMYLGIVGATNFGWEDPMLDIPYDYVPELPLEETSLCLSASDALGSTLEILKGLASELFPGSNKAKTLRQVLLHPEPQSGIPELMYGILGCDLYDEGVRDRFLCAFEEVTNLTSLLYAMHDTNLLYHLTKVAYDLGILEVREIKVNLLQSLNRPQLTEDTKKFFLLQLNLIDQLEAAGLYGLDPVGVATTEKFFEMFDGGDENITRPVAVPPSNLPLKAQCGRIAVAVRKVWYEIKSKQNDSEAVQESRNFIKQWTGIDWNGHTDVLGMICDLLELALGSGLEGIDQWLYDRRVYDHLLKNAYPYVVRMAEYYYRFFEYVLSIPGAEEDESADIFRALHDLFQTLDEMGLFELEDDFNFPEFE